ncbi:hypothetical protein DEALK_17430 [Dehalogenimonas alkenigignens]|uniref:Uncharacterized protein n=1 Tax=Dehalogenimonas alkenigignens TaxID=1217799 RepID=A0A0W0GK01_9CHLR|nr:hypothetical protein [Dehalogenimonas alkenigignens]KTB48896.1 hypothetical protein DEALK_17430 [Dehalogenimonas alkenigignens]
MVKTTAITIAILVCVLVIGGVIPLTGCKSPSQPVSQTTTVSISEQPKLYQQDIKVTIGDSIILGKITDELADLGTINKGDKASYTITIHNAAEQTIKIKVNTNGNISQVATFTYSEIIAPKVNGVITVDVRGETAGFYSGTITVERVG